MKRVMVIGCPGAGKTTLARTLAERTGLPLVHLDQHYWSKGWTPTPRPVWIDKLKSICAAPHWIMDGNYIGSIPQRLEYADTVVVAEKPRVECIFNVLRRTLGSLGITRPDVAEGCPERLNMSFLSFIWGFKARFEVEIAPLLRVAADRGTRVIIVRRRRDLVEALSHTPLPASSA